MAKWITKWFGQEVGDQRLDGCRARLYRLAYAWCNDKQLAEDVVQETLMKAWQYRDSIRQDEAEMAWLCRVLRNTMTDHFRRYGQIELLELSEELCDVTQLTPEENCERSDVATQVRHAVAALPLLQRQIITMIDLEGMSYIQVADILDVPIGTVMSRLSRARSSLRSVLLLKQRDAQPVAYMRRVK